MKTLSTLLNLGTSLTQNLTATNQANLIQLLGDQQRYLIQKYFDNERTATTTTVGSGSVTLTGSLVAGDTSATMTASWSYPTGYQLINFSSGEQRNALFTNGSASLSWADALTQDATTAVTTTGFQYYAIPAGISKMTDNTISVGQLKFTVTPIQTRQEWDRINFLPYNSDIPQYAFIYNGTLAIFPIPSTTGNIITFNYKTRVPDFSTAFLFSDTSGTAYVAGQTTYDYQKGTISGATEGSTSITGSSTSWNTTGKFPLNVDISSYNLYFRINPPYGDGIWYPIYRFNSDTSITLGLPMGSVPSVTGATYSIGQMPVLSEDFHDMLVDGALIRYYSDIVKDPEAKKSHYESYNSRLLLLEDYAGTKQVNVDLGDLPNPVNPNLFLYANS